MGESTKQSNAGDGGGSGLNPVIFYTNREAQEAVLMQEISNFGLLQVNVPNNIQETSFLIEWKGFTDSCLPLSFHRVEIQVVDVGSSSLHVTEIVLAV